MGDGKGSRKDRVVDYIRRCRNFDGGFANIVGSESHAGQGEIDSLFLKKKLSYTCLIFTKSFCLRVCSRNSRQDGYN